MQYWLPKTVAQLPLYDDDDVEFDEDRNSSGRNTSGSRNVPDTWNVQNNYFENNSSGNGENVYAHGFLERLMSAVVFLKILTVNRVM